MQARIGAGILLIGMAVITTAPECAAQAVDENQGPSARVTLEEYLGNDNGSDLENMIGETMVEWQKFLVRWFPLVGVSLALLLLIVLEHVASRLGAIARAISKLEHGPALQRLEETIRAGGLNVGARIGDMGEKLAAIRIGNHLPGMPLDSTPQAPAGPAAAGGGDSKPLP